MRIKCEYHGYPFWAIAEAISVWQPGGELVSGQFYEAFTLGEDPLALTAETVKEDGKTKLFPTEGEAADAAIKAARGRIDGGTGEMV